MLEYTKIQYTIQAQATKLNTYNIQYKYTVVWEKFTVGYFRVKIVRGKIFSSLRVSDENFLTTKYFKVKLFVPLLKNLMHNYT